MNGFVNPVPGRAPAADADGVGRLRRRARLAADLTALPDYPWTHGEVSHESRVAAARAEVALAARILEGVAVDFPLEVPLHVVQAVKGAAFDLGERSRLQTMLDGGGPRTTGTRR